MDVEKTLEDVQDRNRRVELDKAWEVSWARRVTIAALTYAVAYCWLSWLGINDPLRSAAVPVGGYLLSTLSLGVIRKVWMHMR